MYSTEMHEARELGQEFRQLLMGYLRVRHSQNEFSKEAAKSILARAKAIEERVNALIDARLVPVEDKVAPPLVLWQEERPFEAYYEPLRLQKLRQQALLECSDDERT